MGLGAWWHWAIVIVVVLLLFGGKGKLSGLMGDAAKGIRAFRDGLKNEGEAPAEEEPAKPLPGATSTRATTRKKSDNIVN